MSPRQLPPVSGRFVKGRSGNPLGRPKILPDRETILLMIKFFDVFARAYYKQGDGPLRLNQIQKILYAKKVLPTQKP